MPFHGSSTICSPSSIALARTTSSSAVSRATLPISLRYIRTGSSIPIMSAQSASSSSAVGSSSLGGSSLAGASSGSFESTRLAVLADDLDADVAVVVIASAPGGVEIAESSSSSSASEGRDLGRREAAGGELRLLEVGLGPPRAGQNGFDELLIEGIIGMSALLRCGFAREDGHALSRFGVVRRPAIGG